MSFLAEFSQSIGRIISYIKPCILWVATNPSVQLIMLNTFMFTTKISTLIKMKANRIYENTPFLYKTGQILGNVTKFVKSACYNYRVEPNNTNWTNISSIILTQSVAAKYEEKYDFFDESEPAEVCANVLDFLTAKVNKLSLNNTTIDLYTLKVGDKYVYRNLSRVTGSHSQKFDFKNSKIRFLSIEYTHPKMTTTIYLDIPRNAYLIGNEILSATFVLRCLKYQVKSFIFDLDYALNLMDNNIKQFTMNSEQYCLLGEMEYTVKRI